MNLTEQICSQAKLLIRDLEETDVPLLEMLCRSAEVTMRAKLRKGISPEDCKADFIAAASLYALAAMTEISEGARIEQVTAGDLTLRRTGTDAAADSGESVEVDAISGATVTSKAVIRCVNSAIAYVTGADASSGATSWGG